MTRQSFNKMYLNCKNTLDFLQYNVLLLHLHKNLTLATDCSDYRSSHMCILNVALLSWTYEGLGRADTQQIKLLTFNY